jgi:hypothetical protein
LDEINSSVIARSNSDAATARLQDQRVRLPRYARMT